MAAVVTAVHLVLLNSPNTFCLLQERERELPSRRDIGNNVNKSGQGLLGSGTLSDSLVSDIKMELKDLNAQLHKVCVGIWC